MLSTYDTVVQDVEILETVDFDYVILDKAQVIKNQEIARAGGVRRLQSRHRLALTGTQIENHLGDLFSLLCHPALVAKHHFGEDEASASFIATPTGSGFWSQP